MLRNIIRGIALFLLVLAGCQTKKLFPAGERQLLSYYHLSQPDFKSRTVAADFERPLISGYMPDSASSGTTALAGDLPINNGLESFGEFLKQFRTVKLESITYYIVEGDLLYDIDQMYGYYLTQPTKKEAREKSNKLIISVFNQQISRWPVNQVIRYCIQRRSFGTEENFQRVRQNMLQATRDWETTCNVDFVYVESADNSLTGSIPAQVDFIVREVDVFGQFIAKAFFPHYPRSEHKVLIDHSYYTSRFNQVGVLRHELGHVLGFRHEHIRSGAPRVCPGESGPVVELTDYDPNSVMHYFCGEVGSTELLITDLDRDGAQQIYGLPVVTGESSGFDQE